MEFSQWLVPLCPCLWFSRVNAKGRAAVKTLSSLSCHPLPNTGCGSCPPWWRVYNTGFWGHICGVCNPLPVLRTAHPHHVGEVSRMHLPPRHHPRGTASSASAGDLCSQSWCSLGPSATADAGCTMSRGCRYRPPSLACLFPVTAQA